MGEKKKKKHNTTFQSYIKGHIGKQQGPRDTTVKCSLCNVAHSISKRKGKMVTLRNTFPATSNAVVKISLASLFDLRN